jgi:hypothetical protein
MGEATKCVDRGEELLVDQEWQVELTESRTSRHVPLWVALGMPPCTRPVS